VIPLPAQPDAASGEIVTLNDEPWYKICNYDALSPFLMSIVSDADHWLFVSSSGGLTAGRQNAERALFPYITDDKLHDAHHHTGPLAILRTPEPWEPFSDRYDGLYRIERCLYKHVLSNQVCFEEINHDLRLRWTYTWQTSDHFGFVRQVRLTNDGPSARPVQILDGLRNIMPHGVLLAMQAEQSTLVDAYKRNELMGPIGLYSLSSRPMDRPEPAEALRCTSVWFSGPQTQAHLLSERQVDAFRRGQPVRWIYGLAAPKGVHLPLG